MYITMPMFAKLNSIRSSVHLPFLSTRRSSPSTIVFNGSATSPYSHASTSTSTIPQQQQQLPPSPVLHRHRTISTPATNFAETLRVISRQVQADQFDDVFNSFFYTDRRCENRAIFMAARLEQSLDADLVYDRRTITTTIHSFWERVMDRLYTLNYLLYVLPPTHQTKVRYLAALEQHMGDSIIGKQMKSLCGGMETYFALYSTTLDYFGTADLDTMEQARRILEHCMTSESKLGHAERDAMYIFHGLRAGFHGRYQPKVVLDDDDLLLDAIQEAVRDNKCLTNQPSVNPFEEGACIVDSDDDDPSAYLVLS